MVESSTRDNLSDSSKSASEIFLEHRSLIESVISCRVKDEHLRNDVFQDVFIKLSNNPIPANVKSIRPYMYRMVSNYVNDILQKQEIYRRNLYQHNLEKIRKVGCSDESNDSDDAAIVKVFELVESGIPKYLANIIKLKHKDNLSNSEIAIKLDLSKDIVKTYYCLALRKLKEKVKKREEQIRG